MFMLVVLTTSLWKGVSQCINNAQVDKSVEEVSQCDNVDHVDSIVVKGLISLKSQDVDHIFKVRELLNDFFDTPPIGPDLVQDVDFSESMDMDQPSLDTVMKDVKTVVKRRRVMKLNKQNIVIRTLIGPDGNEIPLLPWKEH
nr:hypothetical protein [Tanacetum cinerariifolium]